jgi:O-antigen/teichoic acid export membrane protein
LIGVVCLVCVAAALVVAWLLPNLFPEIPSQLLNQAVVALPILVVGQVCGLALNVAAAYYAGLQRSLEPALIASGARFVSLGATIAVVPFTTNLSALSVAFSVPTVLGLGFLLWRFVGDHPDNMADGQLDRATPREFDNGPLPLLRYSGPLIYWNICVLIVNGSGLLLVGILDYHAVAAYSVATMFAAAVVGVDNALTAPLIAELSRIVSAQGSRSIAGLIHTVTRLNTALILTLSALVIVIAPIFLSLAGINGSGHTRFAVVALVVLAAGLRLVMTPLTMLFIATGTHRRVLWPPLVEAGVGLTLTITLAQFMGAVGVGVGALGGTIVAVILTGTWSAYSAGVDVGSRLQLFVRGVIVPVLCWIPMVAGVVWIHAAQLSFLDSCAVASVGLLLSLGLTWGCAFDARYRKLVLRLPQALLRRKQTIA